MRRRVKSGGKLFLRPRTAILAIPGIKHFRADKLTYGSQFTDKNPNNYVA